MSFNTQPPEGGWAFGLVKRGAALGFNTQPPEGGWMVAIVRLKEEMMVSTHSRPKAAGHCVLLFQQCQNRFNTQPPEGGWPITPIQHCYFLKFQHTAARRRLVPCGTSITFLFGVSTHSRPKAAGLQHRITPVFLARFNTQPPEGGWSLSQKPCSIRFRSPDFAKLLRKA